MPKCKCDISMDIQDRCDVNSENWKKCPCKLETVLYYLLRENTWADSIAFRGVLDTFNNPHISYTIKKRFSLKPREYRELIGLFEDHIDNAEKIIKKRIVNAEKIKLYRIDNAEKIKEYNKQYNKEYRQRKKLEKSQLIGLFE